MDVEVSFQSLLKRQNFFLLSECQAYCHTSNFIKDYCKRRFFYFRKFIREQAQLQNISEEITTLNLTKF